MILEFGGIVIDTRRFTKRVMMDIECISDKSGQVMLEKWMK